MPRRVALIAANFWPEPTGVGQVTWEFARYLADAGLEVRAATAMPYYPQWEIWPAYRRKLWMSETVEGVRIFRSWHRISPSPSTLTRLLHEATLALFSLVGMVRTLWRADVVYLVIPTLTYAFVGSVIARIMRVRRVLIVQDIVPDVAIELGMLRSRALIAVSRRLVGHAYSAAHDILTLSDGMRQRVARQIGDDRKIRVMPNTFDPEELVSVARERNEFRQRFLPRGHDGSFAVVHTGNMGQKQDLDIILRAAQRMIDDRAIHFHVFGDGARKDAFLSRLRELDLSNVSHHPLQDRAMVPHMLSGADVLLICQLPEVVDVVVPSKLMTALGAGGMILASCAGDSETGRILRQNEAGLIVEAGDDQALAEAIRRIERGEVDTQGYRTRARAFALETYSREVVYGPMARALLADR